MKGNLLEALMHVTSGLPKTPAQYLVLVKITVIHKRNSIQMKAAV
jgi:hypothetical protein